MATITGTLNNDTLVGSTGNDLILGQGGADSMVGGDGDDDLQSGYIYDPIRKVLIPDTQGDIFSGGAGNDTIRGGAGNDTMDGGVGNDNLYGGKGNDSITGGAGNDSLNGEGGVDSLVGEDGDDYLNSGQVYDEINNVWRPDTQGDFFSGGAGNDTLYGGAGNDSMDGGVGNDSLNGGGGSDSLIGGDGDDYLRSGNIYDNVNQVWLPDAQGDFLSGGAGNDTMYGDAGNDRMDGGIGNDKLYGGAGNDRMDGGAGNDFIIGDGGSDSIIGGDGDDDLRSGQTFDDVNKVWRPDTQGDVIAGGAGNDTLYGDAGNDSMDGGIGNDTLYGGSGNDSMDGGIGNDNLYGGDGNDTLNGGEGVNALVGGGGDDQYVVNNRYDKITDSDGNDSVLVNVNFFKIPTSIETVTYTNGALKLPYWIDDLTFGVAPSAAYQKLLNGVVYFGFPDAALQRTAGDLGFTPIPAAHRDFVRSFFTQLSQVIGLNFVETTGSAKLEDKSTILFSGATLPSGVGGDGGDRVRVNTFGLPFATTSVAPQILYAHEIGHVLGLKHPFGHPDAMGNIGEGPFLPEAEDNAQWTLMSYSLVGAKLDTQYGSPFDVAALQYLYGVSPTAFAGDTTHVLSASRPNFIWDGSGVDAIDARGVTLGMVLNLSPGHWSYIGAKTDLISAAGQITINMGTLIEQALGGSGDDQIVGNDLNNALLGNAGNDTLAGGVGNDTIDGGAGTDTAIFNGNLANYTLTKSGSTYTVRAKSGTDGTDTLTNIESLKFTDVTVNLQVKSTAAVAPLADVQRISELYVAFFNRTPDADGLAYWIGQKVAGQSINQISEAFYNVGASPTYSSLTGFSTSMSNNDFLNVFYKNVLGRPEGVDAGGLAYWNGKLANGSSTRSSLANDILDSAHTFKGNATWGWVADLLDNKIAVANTIAVDWGLTYNTDAYARGVAIAAAITPTNTAVALALVGVSAADLSIA